MSKDTSMFTEDGYLNDFHRAWNEKCIKDDKETSGFDAIERDALYSRISESTIPKNGRTGKTGRRKAEKRKGKRFKGWVIVAGRWHMGLSDFTDKQPRCFFRKRTP